MSFYTATSPYPVMKIHPQSGLTFPWSETTGSIISHSDAHLGPDGTGLGMSIYINWNDLEIAVQQILGYSWRDTSVGDAGILRRVLPWQHPYFSQLRAKAITSVKGLQQIGYVEIPPFAVGTGAGAGGGTPINIGPFTNYNYAELTIQFWRPPYFVRSDIDVYNPVTGRFQEWLRFVDKNWEINTQMLTREGATLEWLANQSNTTGPTGETIATTTVGQKITHLKLKRRWYQVPEACIFDTTVDLTPNGVPTNMLYTQTATTNPITGYVYAAGQPICGCVNSAIGGGDTDNVSDRFLGCYMGTLLLEAIEFIPQPLQIPAYLMQIPIFAGNEPISQLQYDVVFHFDLFDPPRAGYNLTTNNLTYRGHNLLPYSGDCMWYAAQTALNVGGSSYPGTPFMYADFTDLFVSL